MHNERMSHRKSKSWKPLETDTRKFSAVNPSTPVYLFSAVIKLHFKSCKYSGQSLQMWLLCNTLCRNTMHLNKTKQRVNVICINSVQ